MAAHKIWFIDELIRSILAHLPKNGCERTLAACARVSRSLSEPALDALWYRMSGLLPLVRLLPNSFAEIKEESADRAIFALRGTIDGTEWSRLMYYARRVRKFVHCYAEGPEERLGKHTFNTLVHHAALHGTTLFPRLEELSWLQFSHVAQCLPFFSPPLRRITLYVQKTNPARTDVTAAINAGDVHADYATLLHALDVLSPCIEELSLEGIELPDSLAPSIVFSHIRTLHLGSLSTSTTTILSLCTRMPRLASLSLVLRNPHRARRPPFNGLRGSDGSHSEIPQLSSLEVLRVAGAPSDVEDILDAVDSPSFHSITVSVTVPEHDTDGWTRCSSVLSARFAQSLRTVHAECKRSAAVVPSDARSFEGYVRPLLSLRRIVDCTITIEDPAGIAMADADLKDMATSWPYLSRLDVRLQAVGPPAITLPSILSLAHFARLCPELQTLHLPLRQDVRHLEPSAYPGYPVPVPLRPTPPSPLRNLWMVGVRFSRQESTRVAGFLRGYFPDVDLRPMVSAGILTLE